MKYSRFANRLGFTFIELIMVFSITAILSTLGIAAFVSYSRSQDLRNSGYDLVTFFSTARSNAISQVKPANMCSSSDTLQSYQVLICCRTGSGGPSCPTCSSPDDYELDVVCGNKAPQVVTSKRFPPGSISLYTGSGNTTTSRSFTFYPLSSNVTGSGQIVLQGYGTQQKTITVSSSGVVQLQ